MKRNINSTTTAIVNIFHNGIDVRVFAIGVCFLLLLPFLSKTPKFLLLDKVEVVALYTKKISPRGYSRYGIKNEITTWQAIHPNGHAVTFEGGITNSENNGTVSVAYVDWEDPHESFLFTFSGIYNTIDGIICANLLLLWVCVFFVYGKSKKAQYKIRQLGKWYLQLLAIVGLLFTFFVLIIFPVYLLLFKDVGSFIFYLIIVLIISSQLREAIRVFIYSEEKLIALDRKKREKRRKDTQELNAEILRRRNLKKKK